jgi:Tn3 transposase DDE domain
MPPAPVVDFSTGRATTHGFRGRHAQESRNLRAFGYGGIAYRHIADTYIALFSRFIPCGAWEAI